MITIGFSRFLPSFVFFVLFQRSGRVHSVNSIHTTTHYFVQAITPFTPLHSAGSIPVVHLGHCFYPKKTSRKNRAKPALYGNETKFRACLQVCSILGRQRAGMFRGYSVYTKKFSTF
jgi:hypothetical protein